MARKKKTPGVSDTLYNTIHVDPEETKARLESKHYHKKPDEKPPKKGMLWCRYCGKWTQMSRKKLKCCGISNRDFYIRVDNYLW